ncbi:YczE/YyaS/YitT family protein [Tannockella kyphosi]|uniref:YczE/YyaS/YitT family protein n=1 Tax=Tannockella kyphosi TaxID=2899121 RepID=UPI00201208F8|nr:hypothetical protein [Tannockella kyphosi]
MKQVKRVGVLIFSVALIGMFCAFTMKADIGLGPYDANTKLFSELTMIQIGTVSIVANSICVFIQLVILKKEFTIFHLGQIPVSLLLGVVINFTYYTVLGPLVISSYVGNFLLFLVGIIGCSFSVGMVMVLDIITMALEGACMAVTKKTGIKFHVVRQLVDVVCVIFVVSMCLLCGIDMIIREGTIISALIFGPSMGIFMKFQKRVFRKLDLLKD